MSAIAEFQRRAIAADRMAGAEMFLGIPDAWYEPPNWGCESGHVFGSYIKSERRGALCPVCLKPAHIIPQGYTDETLTAALSEITIEQHIRGGGNAA